jgi:hypothetical protein
MEPFWVVSEMKEKLYVGYLDPLFFPFTEKVQLEYGIVI